MINIFKAFELNSATIPADNNNSSKGLFGSVGNAVKSFVTTIFEFFAAIIVQSIQVLKRIVGSTSKVTTDNSSSATVVKAAVSSAPKVAKIADVEDAKAKKYAAIKIKEYELSVKRVADLRTKAAAEPGRFPPIVVDPPKVLAPPKRSISNLMNSNIYGKR